MKFTVDILIKNYIPLVFVNTRTNLKKILILRILKLHQLKSEIINHEININAHRYLRIKFSTKRKVYTMEKYSDRYGKNIAKRKISFQIFRVISIFFLIDSYLRIFRTTRLKRQHDDFNDIRHAFHTEIEYDFN